MSQDLYIPSYAESLQNLTTPRIFLLIQGAPGRGKTYSALTFPNCLIINLDNKLGVHAGRPIPKLDFWNPEFCKKYRMEQRLSLENFANNYDLVLHFIQVEALKLNKEQSLIFDSWTTYQNWFDTVMDVPYYTSDGKEDGWKFWRLKKSFCKDTIESLKTLSCNVVVLAHEAPERNTKGDIIGVRPLTDGQFADQMAGNFPFVFRQKVLDEKDMAVNKVSIPYVWQIKPDAMCGCIADKPYLPPDMKFVEANYSFFLKDFTSTTSK